MNAQKESQNKSEDTGASGKRAKSDFLVGRSVDDSMEVQFPGSES